MEKIVSRTNEKIKMYRKAVSSKRYRYENAFFAAEGLRLVSDALSEGAAPLFVLVSEDVVSQSPDIIAKAEEMTHGSIFEISTALAEYISDTDSTQGIFALLRMPQTAQADKFVRSGGKYVMLSEIRDPGNLGTIIRTADALGADGVMCCGCCDVFSPKTVRSAMGSIMRIPLCVADEDTAVSAFRNAGITMYAAVPDSNAVSLTDCCLTGGAAAVIGNEGSGLSEKTISACDVKMTVRMKGHAESLNAAAAAAIIIWELVGRE